MSQDFNVGEVICLKSGGPLMTIVSMDNNTAICTWFDNTEQKQGAFPIAGLEAVIGMDGESLGQTDYNIFE